MCNIKQIRAVFDETTVRVYQAYKKEIAEEAISLGTFGKQFNRNRMTWIKPSFLWMMYRCGWAEKEGQEYVLAIDIKREAFNYLIEHAVLSTYGDEMGISKKEWDKLIKQTNIRCQWDPERDCYGNKLPYRSIQLGIRREMVVQYIQDWIVHIEDITDYVKLLKKKKDKKEDISFLLPEENIYPMSEQAILIANKKALPDRI